MELTEYELMQLFSLIYTAQEIAKGEGLNVQYIKPRQMEIFIPLHDKYKDTETIVAIQSLTTLATKLHDALREGD